MGIKWLPRKHEKIETLEKIEFLFFCTFQRACFRGYTSHWHYERHDKIDSNIDGFLTTSSHISY